MKHGRGKMKKTKGDNEGKRDGAVTHLHLGPVAMVSWDLPA